MLALLSHLRLRRSRPQCVVRAQLRWKRRQICGRKTQKAARRTGTRRACAGTAARGPPPRPVTPEHALPVRGAQTWGQARPCSVSRRHGNEKGEDSAGRRGAREAALTELSAWSLCVAGGNLCPTCRRRRGELCIGKGVTCSGHCCPRSADRGRRLSLQDGPESSSQERVQRQTGTSAPRPGCRGPVTA